MYIEYSVKDLIILIMKKWKVILGVGIIFGAISVPISHISYLNALRQYNRYMETGVDINVDIKINISLQTKYGDAIFLTDELKKLVEVDYFERAWKEYNKEDANRDFSNQLVIGEGNITIKDASKDMREFVLFYKKKAEDYLENDYKGDYILAFSSNIQVGNETITNKDEPINMAKILLQKPDKKDDYVKISLTAVLFGIFICTAVVLVVDFCTPVLKSLEELEHYGKIKDSESREADLNICSRKDWIVQRKEIEKLDTKKMEKLTIKVDLYKTPVSAIRAIQKMYSNRDVLSFIVKGKKK